MTGYRAALPQLGSKTLLTDGGLETWLGSDAGWELPDFAAFPLLRSDHGRQVLRRYYEAYLHLAARDGVGIVLDTPTWRANPDWGARLGSAPDDLAMIDRDAVALLEQLRQPFDSPATPVVISGCVGPRYDGYVSVAMSVSAAQGYHEPQVRTFAESAADIVTAMTLTTAEEASGIALSAREAAVPVAISFTTETDGRLPNGMPLGEAIGTVDENTDAYPAYYLVNCAHPSHFLAALDDPVCRARIRGVRANASTLSHAELDESAELDQGDPVALAGWYPALRETLADLTVAGGCCGTDHRHVQAISAALRAG